MPTLIFVAVVVAVLAWAWLNKDSGLLTPEYGVGYWLGVIGASMMAAVLLYPLRKRVRFMRSWMRLPTWFRWHMIFGIVGPMLIVIHSNFGAQSLNALAALVSMLTVVSSGIIGRYLYVRIHRGLYGAKLEVRELLAEAASMRTFIDRGKLPSELQTELQELEQMVTEPARSLARAVGNETRLARRIRHLKRELAGAGRHRLGPGVEDQVSRYLGALTRAGSFVVYDRLFSLWHVLHLPLLFLLVLTAIVHVVAVHLY